MKSLSVAIQMKAIEQYFPVAIFPKHNVEKNAELGHSILRADIFYFLFFRVKQRKKKTSVNRLGHSSSDTVTSQLSSMFFFCPANSQAK